MSFSFYVTNLCKAFFQSVFLSRETAGYPSLERNFRRPPLMRATSRMSFIGEVFANCTEA
jgi:hypothetical protein